MPVEIHLDMSGVAAWLGATPSDRQRKEIQSTLRRIDRQVLLAWGKGGGRKGGAGLGDRTNPTKQKRFGFAPRATGYNAMKRRIEGRATDYVSPRRKIQRPHMRDLLQQPGGVRASSRNSSGDIVTRFAAPGARVLNLAAKNNPQYRKQLIDTQAASFAPDSAWIDKERQRLINAWLRSKIEKTQRKRGKARGAA